METEREKLRDGKVSLFLFDYDISISAFFFSLMMV